MQDLPSCLEQMVGTLKPQRVALKVFLVGHPLQAFGEPKDYLSGFKFVPSTLWVLEFSNGDRLVTSKGFQMVQGCRAAKSQIPLRKNEGHDESYHLRRIAPTKQEQS